MSTSESNSGAPELVNARIVKHPDSDSEVLLAITDDGEHIAFGFDVEGDAPGLMLVDSRLWLEAADEGPPELSDLRFVATEEAWADDWLPALLANPVATEWLARIKQQHHDAYESWFSLEDYEEGGGD